MKRNMDLIRTVLKSLEEKDDATTEWSYKEIPGGYSKDEIYYHYEMLHDANLIKANQYKSGQTLLWRAVSLTWEGHDFLDAAKNDEIWAKAKKVIKEKGGIFSVEILKKILTKLAMGYVFPEATT